MLADNRDAPSPRVYDAEQVDEYIQRMHEQTSGLKARISELEAQATAASPQPTPAGVAGADDIIAEARAEAQALLEQARQRAEALVVEGERLAAAAVIRVLDHIDAIVDEWSEQGRRQYSDVVADLRDRYTSDAG